MLYLPGYCIVDINRFVINIEQMEMFLKYNDSYITFSPADLTAYSQLLIYLTLSEKA